MKTLQRLALAMALVVAGAVDGHLAAQAGTPGQLPAPARDTAAAASTGTGRIRGRVVAAGTNAPLHRVQMVLQWSGNAQFRRLTQTDAQGRYEFTELPVGRFSLNAGIPGYVGLQYGQRRPYENGTPILLRDAETAASIDFALPRGSVITGRVTDENGYPLAQVQIQARRFRYSDRGQRSLVPVGSPDTTDDRGEFRLYGLMPGEYLVDATVRSMANVIGASANPNNPVDGFQPTFYPGTPNAAEAQAITLAIGQETTIQWSLTPARLVRVSGTVRDSMDRPIVAQVQMWVRQADLSTPFSVAPGGSTTVTTAADGSFSFAAVLAGDYVLEVRNRVPGSLGPPPPPEAAFLAVTVRGSDVSGLRVTTSRGSTVSGRVVWEGSAPRVRPGGTPIQLRASAQSADSTFPGTIMLSPNFDESGDFQIGSLFGRVYIGVPTSENSTWRVKSVTLDGQDITDTPVDVEIRPATEGVRITLSDKVSHVAGHVSDPGGKPMTQYVVVMQPVDQKEPRTAARFIRTARPDTEGRFEVRNIRPGRYLATAIEALEDGREFSPEFQKQLRRDAREIMIAEGETQTLDLRLTPGF